MYISCKRKTKWKIIRAFEHIARKGEANFPLAWVPTGVGTHWRGYFYCIFELSLANTIKVPAKEEIMSFNEMVENLKKKNNGKIVFIKTGAFYIATGSDAVFLNKEIGLKCTCFKKQVCKVGFPESAIEKNLQKLREKNIGYAVYFFDNQEEQLIEKYRGSGSYYIRNNENIGCLTCMKNKGKDKYMKALQKLLEEEKKKDENR